MKLFDELQHTDLDPAEFTEPSFEYLNRSARPQFRDARRTIETWFQRYPSNHKTELAARFRSSLDHQHLAAFYELLIYELLLKLGCQPTIHPNVYGTSRSPDFLVTEPGKQAFYLEATTATYQSEEDMAGEARLHEVYDVLNRHVDATDFFIGVEIDSYPDEPPPARKIARFVNSRLLRLDPDDVTNVIKDGGLTSAPQWAFVDSGWSIRFRPIPKKPSARGKPSASPLGMQSTGMQWVDHRTPLRDSLLDKATAYGDLAAPFVVAVNCLEMIDEIDIEEALFGKEKFTVYFDPGSPKGVERVEPSRDLDGLWTSKAGPRNTRLSAVLITRNLRPWSIRHANVQLYHNPWAVDPYSSVLTSLPQAVPKGQQYERIDGASLAELLEVAEA